MNRILVAYKTMSGSTAEVAQAVGKEIEGSGMQVDILPLEKVSNLTTYNAVVIGAPLVMGWHRSAIKFLLKNRQTLRRIPIALFVTGMSLTTSGDTEVSGVPVFVDNTFAKPIQNEGKPSLKERYADINNYAAPILKAAGPAQPVSIAFFGGRLEYHRLKFLAMLFVMLIIQAKPCDQRNWPAIRSWAGELSHLFKLRMS